MGKFSQFYIFNFASACLIFLSTVQYRRVIWLPSVWKRSQWRKSHRQKLGSNMLYCLISAAESAIRILQCFYVSGQMIRRVRWVLWWLRRYGSSENWLVVLIRSPKFIDSKLRPTSTALGQDLGCWKTLSLAKVFYTMPHKQGNPVISLTISATTSPPYICQPNNQDCNPPWLRVERSWPRYKQNSL